MNAVAESPFISQQLDSSGSRQLQTRENSEVMVRVMMAKRFPRDVVAATDKILNAFTRPSLAETAAYQFSRGGTDVSGPSIRAAEAIAQMWGNMSMGFKEVSRQIAADGVPFSEVEAFCWDLESGNHQPLQFIVKHWRDTKKGGYALKDERDIYELIANQAQRRKRACILAMVPGDVVEQAMKQVEITLANKADVTPEGLAKLVDAFAPFGVTKGQIEKRIQRRLDTIRPAQVVALKRIYTSLRDDMSEPADWFEAEEAPSGKPTVTMPQAKGTPPPPPPAPGVDQDTGEIEPSASAAPAPAPAPARAPAGPGVLATDGERKLIVTRAANNDLQLDELLREAGLEHMLGSTDLAGLTKDGFLAMRDLLPKAA